MAQSLSGLESFDPSGSTPQPAPLSGLQLPSLFGGMGGEGGMSGATGPGAAGGQQGGPGLDFYQLLASIQGQGDGGISATPPNLSSLFTGIGGSGGIGSQNLGQMDNNGALTGYGMAGGITQPQAPTGASGVAGSSGGQLDSIALLRQALGLGQTAARGLNTSGTAGNTSGGGTGDLSISDFGGTSLSNAEGATTASPFQGGDLVSSFLNDPTLGQFATGGGLLRGATIPSELWDTFKNDPQFLEALRSGNAFSDSNLISEHPLGGTGGLEMPDLSGSPGSQGAGSQTGASDVSSGLGGINSLLGLVQNFQNAGGAGTPISMLQNLYGAYSAANNLGGLGGPTISGLLDTIGAGGLGGYGLGALSALPGILESNKPGDAAASAAGGLITGSMGGTLAGIASIPAIWELANSLFAHQYSPQEHNQINADFLTGLPAYQGAPDLFKQIMGENDPAALGGLLQNANYAVAQAPAISHYISTYGGADAQHGRQDLSAYENTTQPQQIAANLGYTSALDKLFNAGVQDPVSQYNVSDFWANPQSMLTQLSGAAGLPRDFWSMGGPKISNPPTEFQQFYTEQPGPYNLSQEQQAMFAPGHRLQGINQFFGGINPNYAQSPLAQILAQYGA